MASTKVAPKTEKVTAPAAVPKGMEMPEVHMVVPKETLFGILQDLRDEAIKKDPKSLLASYSVDSLVYAVQNYRLANKIEIWNITRTDPLKDGDKFAADGSLKKIQVGELLPIKEALSESTLRKLHLALANEKWETGDIWINPATAALVKPPPKAAEKKAIKSDPHSKHSTTKTKSPETKNHHEPQPSPGQKEKSPKNLNPPWFSPPSELSKHVTVASLKSVESWRDEVEAAVKALSSNKRLAPFIPAIDKILGVTHRESKGDPEAMGDFDKSTGLPRSFGLHQIQVATANRYVPNITQDKLLDGGTNIAVVVRELAELHRKAAHGDPAKINSATINTAIGAHNVGIGWLFKEEFSPARRAKLENKVATYLREVDYVASNLKNVGQTLLATSAKSKVATR